MAKKKTVLEQMEANPRADWSIKNIETLCSQTGLLFKPPSNGSHYKVTSETLHAILPVPFKRPIKAFYIKDLVKFARAHMEATEARSKKGE